MLKRTNAGGDGNTPNKKQAPANGDAVMNMQDLVLAKTSANKCSDEQACSIVNALVAAALVAAAKDATKGIAKGKGIAPAKDIAATAKDIAPAKDIAAKDIAATAKDIAATAKDIAATAKKRQNCLAIQRVAKEKNADGSPSDDALALCSLVELYCPRLFDGPVFTPRETYMKLFCQIGGLRDGKRPQRAMYRLDNVEYARSQEFGDLGIPSNSSPNGVLAVFHWLGCVFRNGHIDILFESTTKAWKEKRAALKALRGYLREAIQAYPETKAGVPALAQPLHVVKKLKDTVLYILDRISGVEFVKL
jgi:hypothetical protein